MLAVRLVVARRHGFGDTASYGWWVGIGAFVVGESIMESGAGSDAEEGAENGIAITLPTWARLGRLRSTNALKESASNVCCGASFRDKAFNHVAGKSPSRRRCFTTRT